MKQNVTTFSSFLQSDARVLLLVGLGVALVNGLTNGQYGFHRDELDILMNANALAWGYVAYPPLTPFLARIGLELFGLSLIGLRLFPALAQGIVAVLVGGMARDFGGSRRVQIIAALAVAVAPVALTTGTLMQYMSFDYLWWVLLAFFTVRLLTTGNPRWWLGIGAAIGLGMMTKYTLLFFIAGLVVAVLLTPARRYLRSPWLWGGAGLALLIFLPNLVWQVQHGFISLEFLNAIHARDISWGRANSFLPDQLYATTNPFLLPLWVAGLYFCLFSTAGRRFRALGIQYLVTFLLLWASQGRSYYLAPAYPMLVAAGTVWFESWFERLSPTRARVGRIVQWGMLAAGGLMGLLLIKPVAPVNSPLWDVAIGLSDVPTEMIGWPELAEQVSQIAAGLPAEERARTAVLAGNYGEAGALMFYGEPGQMPPVISGGNSMWERGYGSPPPETIIAVGFEPQYASPYFDRCQPAGQVTNRYGVKNEESTRHTTIFICREPHQPWDQMWPKMRWFQ